MIQIALKAGHYRADDGSSFNAGLVTLYFSKDPDKYCLETYIFVIIQGGGSGPLSPLWIRA